MVHIKICGMCSIQDIQCVNEVKVDYAGFVFASGKHQISIREAKNLIPHLNHSKSVGVFVNEQVDEIAHIANTIHLDVIQLHGEESQKDIQYLKENTPCEVWKAIRLHTLKDYQLFHELHPDRFLVDSFDKSSYGGTGKRIKKELLASLDLSDKILAGGINAQNVQEILSYRPYMIDVSSGVETNGSKDIQKIRKLISEVKK